MRLLKQLWHKYFGDHTYDADIKKFCKEWVEWAEAGGIDGQHYNNRIGLCSNIRLFKYPSKDTHLINAFNNALKRELGDNCYPFGGRRQYAHDAGMSRMHLNPERLAWARKKANESL